MTEASIQDKKDLMEIEEEKVEMTEEEKQEKAENETMQLVLGGM